jgi:hypothetical protein
MMLSQYNTNAKFVLLLNDLISIALTTMYHDHTIAFVRAQLGDRRRLFMI